jgi:hypothetical protein
VEGLRRVAYSYSGTDRARKFGCEQTGSSENQRDQDQSR